MLLRFLKMFILLFVNLILWNILLNIFFSWCWMFLLLLLYNIGFFLVVNIVIVCNLSYLVWGLVVFVEIFKYICIYSYVFFIDNSIIIVIYVIYVCF